MNDTMSKDVASMEVKKPSERLHSPQDKTESGSVSVDVKARYFDLGGGETLHAVDNLQFTLPADSFTCIIGPSGCGKTTTLRMILGLDTDFTGSILIPGNGVVSAVFQEPRLLPWRTVEQNIRLVLPANRQNDELDELLSDLGLNEMRSFYPGQLSLGLARRAALARAFILEPQLLILDEPFVSLDESTAMRLRKLLLTLWRSRPTTALMVTHNALEAAMLADRILVFSDRPARIVDSLEIDTPREERDSQVLADVVARLGEVQERDGEG